MGQREAGARSGRPDCAAIGQVFPSCASLNTRHGDRAVIGDAVRSIFAAVGCQCECRGCSRCIHRDGRHVGRYGRHIARHVGLTHLHRVLREGACSQREAGARSGSPVSAGIG